MRGRRRKAKKRTWREKEGDEGEEGERRDGGVEALEEGQRKGEEREKNEG